MVKSLDKKGITHLYVELLKAFCGYIETSEDGYYITDGNGNIGYKLPEGTSEQESYEIKEVNEDGLYFVDSNNNIGYKYFTSTETATSDINYEVLGTI